ncbi:DUF5753 domain-containing protein [Pseudonocardia oroxyli]|uniref:DUF5753 domain-containing protein n=1 Tax=Pseudonocardia oroxyli TaxID=366584 RepID=A0A1G7ZBI4_PSEOR|nr:DUF5753 domain-containing protein [Pseudonocardia oroxyli]SDH05886.1 hypothetical protein SAMN05216377_11885 [Pseudonocardia oroxyli]
MTAGEARRYIAYENAATLVRSYEPERVPGILQTRRYAEVVVSALFPRHSQAERSRFVDLRLARRQVLDRTSTPPRLDLIIGELTLRRQVGSSEVVREQIQSLLDITAEHPTVSLRVAPLRVAHPSVFGGPYVVMDLADPAENGVVYLETRGAPEFLHTDQAVDDYRNLHTELSAVVLTREDSQSLLSEILAAST